MPILGAERHLGDVLFLSYQNLTHHCEIYSVLDDVSVEWSDKRNDLPRKYDMTLLAVDVDGVLRSTNP